MSFIISKGISLITLIYLGKGRGRDIQHRPTQNCSTVEEGEEEHGVKEEWGGMCSRRMVEGRMWRRKMPPPHDKCL